MLPTITASTAAGCPAVRCASPMPAPSPTRVPATRLTDLRNTSDRVAVPVNATNAAITAQ